MPRWQHEEHTGRTAENRRAHSDGLPCPSCNFTETKFRFLNNKKKTQPRYKCLTCNKHWTVGGKTRGPYNTRSAAVSNPVVADPTSQPPPTAASEPPAAGAVRRSQRDQMTQVSPGELGWLLYTFFEVGEVFAI